MRASVSRYNSFLQYIGKEEGNLKLITIFLCFFFNIQVLYLFIWSAINEEENYVKVMCENVNSVLSWMLGS